MRPPFLAKLAAHSPARAGGRDKSEVMAPATFMTNGAVLRDALPGM